MLSNHICFLPYTSIVLINFSVSASSSHLHSSSLSGLVATTLLGPIAASEISLLNISMANNYEAGHLPASQSKQVARNWNRLAESIHALSRRGLRVTDWQPAGNNGERGSDVEVKSRLDVRCILAGEDGPRVNRLALGD